MASTATFTATFTTAGTFTWVAPAGVTSVSVQCWGGGAGGSGGSWDSAGGGGEYAAELTNTVVAGDSYSVVVGAAGSGGASDAGNAGGNSTFSGTSATTVTAHGGSVGSASSSGAGGTGSSNSVHFNGGAGGSFAGGGSGGLGGGGSGGTASAGNTGGESTGSSGGAGATAVSGGGPGGNGGASGGSGSAPTSGPGGGGGGAGNVGGSGGAGFAGQVVITWTMASPAVIAANTANGTYQWTAPSGVTSVNSQCWGGGGGAFNGNNIVGTAGGGGGEYAAELTNTVVAGDSYTVVVGAAGTSGGGNGGNSTFSGTSATTVTAHGGSGAGQTQTGAAGGTGSSNSVHYNGGSGGNVGGSGDGGGGGGGSGGTGSAGNAGSASTSSSGAAGATAVTGGGPGGSGGTGSAAGSTPSSGPGGGAGGGGVTSSSGAAGYAGQVVITWSGAGSAQMPQPGGRTWRRRYRPAPIARVVPSQSTPSTLLTNNFEGGTLGNAITTTNAGGTGNSQFSGVTTGTGAGLVFDNTVTHSGQLSAKMTMPPSGVSSYLQWNINPGSGQYWYRAYLWIAAPVTSYIMQACTAGGTLRLTWLLLSSGRIVILAQNGDSILETTASVNTGAWVRLEGYFTAGSGTNGVVSLSVYNSADSTTPTETDSASVNTADPGATLADVAQLRFGGISGGGPIGPVWLDDLGISTQGYLGPTGYTGSAVTYTQAPQAGGGRQWRRRWRRHQTLPPLVAPPVKGSVALAPLAISATGAVSPRFSASMALAPLKMAATDIEDFNATGSLRLSPLAMSGAVFQALPFPQGVLSLKLELLVNGTWTDITEYVYQRDNIVITRGKPNETTKGTQAPSNMTLTLNNRDGSFTDSYPLGQFYPYIGLNTQVRLSANTDVLGESVAYRFWGVVSEWPPSWDPTGSDIYVQIVANGVLRRLTQAAALRSALYRYITSLATPPLAYWPAEDGMNATSLASGVQGGFPMTWTGTPTLASDSGFPASAPVPVFGNAVFTGQTGAAGAIPVANFAVFGTRGSGNWQAPANITSAVVQCWGAGGPGGGYNGTQGGSGGGGGEYAQDSVSLTPGDSYAYTVGSGASGGNSEFTGNSSFHVIAHGGGAGDAGGIGDGGTGGTGSSNAAHYAGGAGAAGSGGPGGGGSETQQSFASSVPGANTWEADSTITGTVTAYLWGAGGGAGSGDTGSTRAGGGGGGGNFNYETIAVTGGNSYSYSVGTGGTGGAAGDNNGGAGGASQFAGDSQTLTVHGGFGGANGHAGGGGGGPSSDSGGSGLRYGGSGALGGTPGAGGHGGGGGGGAGLGGDGGSASGATAGSGGNSGGLDEGGGSGGEGATSETGTGSRGNGPGGGGGGGGSSNEAGGGGANGRIELYWYDSSAAPAAAVGGGGGSSGGSASAGNDGATEAGGAAVTGGGPGGGTLSGSSFNASPLSSPGGGGGGYDSLGGPADGADGQVIITYAASGGGSAGVTANVERFLLHVPAGGDTSGAAVMRMYTTGTVTYLDVIYSSTQQLVLPASTDTVENSNPIPVNVTVAGGTVSEIAVNGVNQEADSGTFLVPSGETIAVTYSVAPTTFTTAPVGTDGFLTLSGFSASGAQLFSTGAQGWGVNGALLMVSAELQTSGSNITYNLTALQAGDTAEVGSAGSTYDGAVLGNPFTIVPDPGGDLASTSFGHLLISETYDPLTDYASALAAYAGENAADRFTRLCTEEGIGSSIVGTDTDTALMGPQLPEQLVTLLQECEDADMGLLYEDRDSLGLVYQTRTNLYNQSPAIQLNYATAQFATPMQPTKDDQLTRNDVTLTRTSGSSSEQMKTTGSYSTQDPPDGVGVYTYSGTVNVESDGQLPDSASWLVWIGTADQLRYPVLYMDLSRTEAAAYFTAATAMDIGAYMQGLNPPFWLPTGSIDQLCYGFTETLNAFIFKIGMNCVPEQPYEVAIAGAPGTGSRADTDGSLLHQGIGTADTTFPVDTPAPNAPWVNSTGNAGEFPVLIVMGGEVMTCTGIDTSSPQNFTVERGYNGIIKAHSAGEAVSVFEPAVVAL